MAPVTQLKFTQAFGLHQQGMLDEAERLYADVILEDAAHFDAIHLLGVIALQTRRDQKCVELITRAIGLNANMAEAHCNLGNALRNLKRFEEARAAYENAIALKPNMAEAHNSLGNVLRDLKRYDVALQSYDKAIALKPDYAEAHSNRGTALHDLKRFDEALVGYQKAIALSPYFAEAHGNRGNTLKDLKRFNEAIAAYDQAIALAPGFAEAHNSRATALRDLRRLEDALLGYDQAIAFKPDYEDAYRNKGLVLMELKRFDEALMSFDKAIAFNPNFAEAYHNRGTVLTYMDRFDEALINFEDALRLTPPEEHYARGIILSDLKRLDEALLCYDKAIAFNPHHVEAHNNRGVVLADLKRFDEALSSYDQVIALEPDFAEAYSNKSFCLLLNGCFDEGWRLYEWRDKKPELRNLFAVRSYARPRWHGLEPINGKTLFVYWEQGLGDTIQFCRYLKQAHRLGARVIFSARDCMHALLKTLDLPIEVIGETEMPLQFDYHSPLLSLPLAFNASLENIPADVPYLHAEPERIERWKQRLGRGGFKIGVAWKGSSGKIDIGRSFALSDLHSLSQIPGVRLISLQKDGGLEQLIRLPDGMQVEDPGADFDAGANAFLDTAAVMENLDLIISSDTAIAHLAGALGRPVWVALKAIPDWRWMMSRDDSPWYPSMRLFRQNTAGSWTNVFSSMTRELSSMLHCGGVTD
jgi:tetratricopeptide (TPR) repeat protein